MQSILTRCFRSSTAYVHHCKPVTAGSSKFMSSLDHVPPNSRPGPVLRNHFCTEYKDSSDSRQVNVCSRKETELVCAVPEHKDVVPIIQNPLMISQLPQSEVVVSSLLAEALVLDAAREVEFPSDTKEGSIRRLQHLRTHRPKIDPTETSVLMFPGQGSQFVGMGKSLLAYPNVSDMYGVASEVLGYDLLDLCVNGPRDQLNRTEYCQAAILVTSLAAVEKLRHDNSQAIDNCIAAAGFSVGEFAALVFAGAIDFEDAVSLIKVRGEAMQRASEETPSGMATVLQSRHTKLGFACHAAQTYCRERLGMPDAECKIANYLFPEGKVIAGNEEALDFITKNAGEFGIRKMKRLPVSGAFHTQLMHSARADLNRALRDIDIRPPIINVHSNVKAIKYRSPQQIRKLLSQQMCKSVYWEQTMHVLFSREQGEEFPYVYELGPGKQLGTLLQKVNAKAHQRYKSVPV